MTFIDVVQALLAHKIRAWVEASSLLRYGVSRHAARASSGKRQHAATLERPVCSGGVSLVRLLLSDVLRPPRRNLPRYGVTFFKNIRVSHTTSASFVKNR